jgi:hypothetical protein
VYGLSSAGTTSNGVSHWGDTKVLASLAAVVVLLAAFIIIEARSRHALMPLRMPNVGQQVDGAIGLAILGTVAWTVVANTARHAAAVARGAAAAAVKAGHQCPDMVDMEVIVRLQN